MSSRERAAAEIPSRSTLVRRPLSAARTSLAPSAPAPTPATATPAAPTSADHADFAAACLPMQPELYAAGMRLCRNPADAKDLVQETLLRAMCAWDRFEPGSNLRAWLLRILTNSFINGYRKRRRHSRLASERPADALCALYGQAEDHAPDHAQALCAGELADEVAAALAGLGADYRDVVERADLRGEKYKDIADELAVPIGTVMSRLFRARRQLEVTLRDYAADSGIKRAA